MHARTHALVGSLLVAALAACAKTEPTGASGSASASAATTGTAATIATAASTEAVASAVPDASPSGADTTTGTAAPGGPDAAPVTAPGTQPTKDAGATAVASAAGSAAPAASADAACGTKPHPDCPLQAWMKANANPPVMTSDTAALAGVLDKIAAFAPPGYTNWASISRDGANAARAGDLAAAKASCRGCHDQYKQKYKTEMRARKI